MADTNAKRDENFVPVALSVTNDANLNTRPWIIDPVTGRILVDLIIE